MESYEALLARSDIHKNAYVNNTLVSANIELCTVCNWRCRHCYLPEHNNEGLSKKEIFTILEELREMGCFNIMYTGGEIFCRSDAMDIIRKTRELGFNVDLYTNISLLNEDMIKELAELHISGISCTLFSLNEETHDKISGVEGSLKNTLNNIKLIKKYGIKFEIKNILMRDNHNSYKEIWELCKENSFDFRATPNVWARYDGDTSFKEWMVTNDQLKEIIPEIDSVMEITPCEVNVKSKFCNSINFSMVIDSKGDAYPCINMHIKIGNVLGRNVGQVWENSIKLKEIRTYDWSYIPECLECDDKGYCMRCAGTVELETGSLFGKEKLACMIGKVRRKSMEK